MSLRTRLFLIFGGLVCLLLLAQWLMFRSLSMELGRKTGDLAFHTVRDFAHVVSFYADGEAGNKTGDAKVFGTKIEQELVIDRHGDIIDKKSEDVVVKKYAYTHKTPGDASPPQMRTKVVRWHLSEDNATTVDEIGSNRFFMTSSAAGSQASNEPGAGLNESFVIRLEPGPREALVLASPSFEQRIPLRKDLILESLAKRQGQFLAGSMGVLVVGLIIVAMAAHRVSSPLRLLATTAESVGKGNLGVQIPEQQVSGEVGIAIREFNKMSAHLKELETQAQTMRQREYLSELGEIANGLAHTIRNPLNTLGLALDQIAAAEPRQNKADDLVPVARAQIRRIDQWVRSFLALASQGSARQDQVRLDGIVQDVVLEALQDGGAGNRRLDVVITPDLPPVSGVEPELRAVIQALVVNAVEASPPAGKVTVNVARLENDVVITVTDEGPGLPQQVRDKLFTPHVTTKETGSGMGLFLANRIITSRYGGRLCIEDRPTGGTSAIVTLPLAGESSHA